MIDIFSIEDRGHVRRLTIERPEAKNAIPTDAWRALTAHLRDFEESPSRVLVITGRDGDFCSGADLSEDAARSASSAAGESVGSASSAADYAGHMRNVGEAAVTLHRLTKPTIAAVDGVAIGAGMNLALGCDVVIATDRARFAEIFVRRGLTVDFGGSWLLPRLVGLARARELALTGRMVEAPEAVDIGLVNRVVAPEDLEDAVAGTAEALAAAAPLAQRLTKAGLDRAQDLTFEQAIEMEGQAQSVLLTSRDFREAVAAFTEKRPPRFEGR